jgi:hypothetical protein
LAERGLCKPEVRGSNPLASIKQNAKEFIRFFCSRALTILLNSI